MMKIDVSRPIAEVMTHDDLITVPVGTTLEDAEKILHQHRVEKLLVVDEAYVLKGLITVKDIQKKIKYPNAAKDLQGRLRVGAAIGATGDFLERAQARRQGGAGDVGARAAAGAIADGDHAGAAEIERHLTAQEMLGEQPPQRQVGGHQRQLLLFGLLHRFQDRPHSRRVGGHGLLDEHVFAGGHGRPRDFAAQHGQLGLARRDLARVPVDEVKAGDVLCWVGQEKPLRITAESIAECDLVARTVTPSLVKTAYRVSALPSRRCDTLSTPMLGGKSSSKLSMIKKFRRQGTSNNLTHNELIQ